jgi:hypothetical protein
MKIRGWLQIPIDSCGVNTAHVFFPDFMASVIDVFFDYSQTVTI